VLSATVAPGLRHGHAWEVTLMATRKKKEEPNGSTTRAFTVAVEQLQGQFKVFGEQLGAVREDVAVLRGEVGALRGEVGVLRGEVGVLREQVTTGFAQVDQRFERVEHEIGLLKVAVIEQGRELKKKVDRDEVEAIVERAIARSARH
jgi:hypothetical protein